MSGNIAVVTDDKTEEMATATEIETVALVVEQVTLVMDDTAIRLIKMEVEAEAIEITAMADATTSSNDNNIEPTAVCESLGGEVVHSIAQLNLEDYVSPRREPVKVSNVNPLLTAASHRPMRPSSTNDSASDMTSSTDTFSTPSSLTFGDFTDSDLSSLQLEQPLTNSQPWQQSLGLPQHPQTMTQQFFPQQQYLHQTYPQAALPTPFIPKPQQNYFGVQFLGSYFPTGQTYAKQITLPQAYQIGLCNNLPLAKSVGELVERRQPPLYQTAVYKSDTSGFTGYY